MIPEEVLSQLRDIETPPPAGLWPPAPGWWIVGALALLILIAGTYMVWRRHHRRAPRREALARLAAFGIPEQAGTDWYAALNRLLKQAASNLYPDDRPAALSGDQWRDFLARTSDTPGHTWQQLVSACYRPDSNITPGQAHQLVEQWIRRQPW
ncbi:DUF4381 domain-containing protein [Marinobacter sp.]|uniref:DUF4381 domain-containing protein n=1 Tax=Marinobacter sp. TaxID=50741 RepID=UPI00356A5B6A